MDCNNSGVTAINKFFARSSFSIATRVTNERWVSILPSKCPFFITIIIDSGWGGHWPNTINYFEYYYPLALEMSCVAVVVVSVFMMNEAGPGQHSLVGIYIILPRLPRSAITWTVLGVSGLETVWSIYSSFSPPHPYCTMDIIPNEEIYFEYSTTNE